MPQLGVYQLGTEQIGTTEQLPDSAIEFLLGNYEHLEDSIGYDTPLTVEPDSDFQAWLEAFATEYDRIDSDQSDVLEAHHVTTAEGSELERIGQLFNVKRRTNETDEQLRQRIRIRGSIAVTSGTTNEMMELSALALETTVDDLYFPIDLAANPATFSLSIPQEIMDNAALTQSTVERELERALPVGHRIDVTIAANELSTMDMTFNAGFT
jgi:hypothetical protein